MHVFISFGMMPKSSAPPPDCAVNIWLQLAFAHIASFSTSWCTFLFHSSEHHQVLSRTFPSFRTKPSPVALHGSRRIVDFLSLHVCLVLKKWPLPVRMSSWEKWVFSQEVNAPPQKKTPLILPPPPHLCLLSSPLCSSLTLLAQTCVFLVRSKQKCDNGAWFGHVRPSSLSSV